MRLLCPSMILRSSSVDVHRRRTRTNVGDAFAFCFASPDARPQIKGGVLFVATVTFAFAFPDPISMDF